jgi:hypothetical protein
MQKSKEAKLSDHMDAFHSKQINYNDYEISFRRWLVCQLDSGQMSLDEVRDRFQLSRTEYKKIIRKWQERYSDELHLSLSFMSSKERADNKKLEARIKELEKQLEYAKMKDVALNTLIDVAEKELKISIRKKSGSKQ